MQYVMMPLNEHYDLGFGAIAEAFRTSALSLKENKKNEFFGHLPQSFLFRHSVELFLKSGIVILHRKLKLPFDTKPYDGAPMVPVGGTWRPIYSIHSIGTLYSYWKSLIDPRLQELKEMCKFKPDWAVQADADTWIKIIDDTDPNSTYFRYPSTKNPAEDQEKSPFKKTTKEDLFPPDRPDGKKITALVIENADGEFVRAYIAEKDADEAVYVDSLEGACEMLFNYHAMMRMELTGGF
jgi:hypothetical protein